MKLTAYHAAACEVLDEELYGERPRGLSPELQKHLAECTRCRRLYDALAFEPAAELVPEPVLSRIRERFGRSLRPVRPPLAVPVLAAQFLGAFLILLLGGTMMMGLGGFHRMASVQFATMAAVLGAGAALLALLLAWQITPGSLRRFSAKSAAVVLGFGYATGLLGFFPWTSGAAFVETGWPCLKAGLIMAIPAIAVFWILARQGVALSAGVLGAMLGAQGGLTAVTVLQLSCIRQEAAHLLVWHGGALLLVLLGGILIPWVVQMIADRHRNPWLSSGE